MAKAVFRPGEAKVKDEKFVETYHVDNDGTEYFVGKMLDTEYTYELNGFEHIYSSKLIVDGHDYSGNTYRSAYRTAYKAINNYRRSDYDVAAYSKFNLDTYSKLQTVLTVKKDNYNNNKDGAFKFTLYAGWEANTYQVYYEANSNYGYDENGNAMTTDIPTDQSSYGRLPYVSGNVRRDEHSDLAVGSSPSSLV